MTEQEQQLLQAILRWDNAKALELAMLLVKGINLEDRYWKNSLRFAKRVIPRVIKDCQNENNSPIPMDRFLNTAWKGDVKTGGENMMDLALIYILYSLYQDSYQEVETLDVFTREGAEERMQESIPFFAEGISSGTWQLKEYPEELRGNREIVFSAVRQDGSNLQYASIELQSDPELIALIR